MAIDDYLEHMPPLVPPEDVHEMSRLFLEKCPVVHSDQDNGFWLVNRHRDVLRTMQDQPGFASGNRGVRVPTMPVDQPPMPPIDSNPPLHRSVREIMNPFLSPQTLAKFEPMFRSIIAGHIDEFAGAGQCDLATQLAKKFPSQITSQFMFKVSDPAELDQLRHWVRRLSYDMLRDDPKVLKVLQQEWTAWCQALVEKRRDDPQDDIVTALVHQTVDGGRHLSDDEVVGAIQILTLGGFSTTADATCNIVIRLIEDPTLEPLLREHPEKMAAAIEEIMRLEPPVTARPRRATKEVEIDGHLVAENDRVLCNYLAANVDPEEWENPEDFIIDRTRNRVTTFGVGPHRCIGSNMARMSLRIMLEELLKRATGLAYADGAVVERISFNPSAWRAVDSLPITFTPIPA